jgi:hypothetical protein
MPGVLRSLKIKAQKNGMLYSPHDCRIGLDFQNLYKKLVSSPTDIPVCLIYSISVFHFLKRAQLVCSGYHMGDEEGGDLAC